MNREVALELVEKQLTERRYQHTLGVTEAAIELANRYGADVKKAELAAIFHDYAKFRPKDEMRGIIVSQGMTSTLLDFHSELWHAPVGAYLVEKEAGITNTEILDAIRYHTSGRVGMTLLDKVIYLADYIEPGRLFPGVDEVRETAKISLNQAVIEAMRNTIVFLMKKKQAVYPDTFHSYNDLIMKTKEKIE
ncbi:bis(5'-nucleosyl)-tetraphosphatase (symmetrical) YqeK [Peribacillus psychrosaccharolyticus]|uniref:bis(5'-nucleosyl)-tetraphosphatase (symmetrical) n=1 Tax=Peribacillus psychrosaccharolyticus TaxID=1407 RepID=A0A974NL90_PERPY|nr:bis(5'-nucleosyl)-tetraphosphatase (symmetrical) YqeK [Peribacillus psychrosaccharolyticus]MEC2054361.1 bis(5'-nucleosyl)-tetraphosphatase (symmetrical) YqeK [Peribacillus psychrosaccharolyticus]MED3744411.1 bis(5'-nucleosyl)-tetraphosphatase (symmetrical) YqeK [Peribacillus psychrosaccharolyticus]QQS99883.1 bis(5'-nucleosyl)-tetraphosphatase (symmetrical) YqeK [Peribacillus psychrosaccharolyticus]